MSSSTVKYKARRGDTVENIAVAIAIKSEEIIALNQGLKLKPSSRLVPGKIYVLPRNTSHNSFGAVNDIVIEWNARKVEAEKDD